MRRHEVRSVTILTNPAAGHGNAPHAAERAIAHFQKRGVECIQIVGVDAEDALRLSRETLDRGTDAFVVVGGDGVISIALQALAGGDVPLGIIPAGTGNDHAREYGLPTAAPEAATDVVVDGWSEEVDLGHIVRPDGSEKWFGTVMASGFDSLVSDRTNRMTWPHGRMRYNLAIVAEFFNLKALPFRLVLDGDTVIEQDVTLVAFGNTRSYGGGMLITPDADRSDGFLDITLVSAGPRNRLIRLFPTVFKGTHVKLPDVHTYRARSVTVESPGITAYADGEYASDLPVTVSAVPNALRILVPKE
ncbi:diacylglycerol kinase [Rhodococcus triatomae]|nr:diacylglycerol kinase [Rhodococcus triatomae]QNG25653.1 diacylglycerol kinase [Rhodococcus triatomae]